MAKKMVRNEKGFTLIELVIVIVILGILAAFAVSRYSNMAQSARIAAVNGMAGGLRSAVAVVQGQYLAVGAGTTPVTMLDGTTVAVSTGAAGGIPTGAAAGIGNAMRDTTGFTIDYTVSTAVTFWPTNGGSATCQAAYNGTTGIVTTPTPLVC